jgi:hypothetical protein
MHAIKTRELWACRKTRNGTHHQGFTDGQVGPEASTIRRAEAEEDLLAFVLVEAQETVVTDADKPSLRHGRQFSEHTHTPLVFLHHLGMCQTTVTIGAAC